MDIEGNGKAGSVKGRGELDYKANESQERKEDEKCEI